MNRGIQNPAKHLKWSRKERLAKNELWPRTISKINYSMCDRDVNTSQHFNILEF